MEYSSRKEEVNKAATQPKGVGRIRYKDPMEMAIDALDQDWPVPNSGFNLHSMCN